MLYHPDGRLLAVFPNRRLSFLKLKTLDYPIDPNNPLLDSTYLPPVVGDELDNFDIVNRLELIKATAPFYGNDIKRWKEVLNELDEWLYGCDDEIEFRPDAAEGED